jgi:autotransporter-associated beta strand protein
MAGQSNTQGHGEISPATTPGTLSYITTPANDPQSKYQFLKDGANWVVRDDVFIHYQRNVPLDSGVREGGLTVGYGANSGNTTIGPELGFGSVLGDLHGDKILLIKTCWGGKSLGVDFLPPSSENYPPPLVEGDKGFFYQKILEIVNHVTASLGDHVPGYADEGFEIAGFGWHQGWNDRTSATLSAVYETNMANFINDIRDDLNAPNMPFVIATTGMDGGSAYTTVELAQLKMADATAYPAFAGNVRVVDARKPYDGLDFWQPVALSPSDQGYHWNRNAKTYLHLGLAMGDAMSFLVKPPQPYRLRASGTSSGITLTWENGTETPSSVRILRNGVEIAAGLPATPTTYVDATAPPGVHDYQVEFTMPGDPVAPLNTTYDGSISGLQAFRAPGGVLLTWTNAMNYPAIEIRRDNVVVAAALSGDDTSWFDATAPGSGLVTYTAAPTTGTTTPASVQINLSAAPSGNAVIYEPFEYAVGGLSGKGGSETGLSGTWTATTANIASGSLAYGLLLTAGNSIGNLNSGSNNFGGTRQISPAALSATGLLEDGATLWFSVVMGYGTGGNLTNSRLAFALANSSFSAGNGQYFITDEGSQLGSGLGVTLGRFDSNGKVVATQFRDATRGTSGFEGNVFGNVPSSTIGASQQRLVIGKITWGAGSDLIELYEPDTNLNLGPVTSSLAVSVNQASFDTLTFSRGDVVTLDEIRFGANLEDVLGVDTASGYWDLNGTTTGAGGADGDKPSGIWNTDANWNAAFTGTGPLAPWADGNKAVFAAGTNATGAYTVTIDGTRDIGGITIEEGSPTLEGGTALRMTRDSTIGVQNGLTATLSTPLTENGARSLSKEGGGTLVLTNTNSYTGSTYLSSGTLQADIPATLPGFPTSNKIVFNGGTLGLPVGGGWSTAQVNSLLGAAAKFSGSLGIDTTAGDLTQWTAFTNAAGSFGASLGLTKLGPNTLTLDQANTFAGPTGVRQGTLALAHNLALQNSALASGTTGSITLSGMDSPTFGGLLDSTDLSAALGAGYANVSTLTLNPGTGKLAVYGGAIANGGPGMTLVKTGAGTQVLRGENTYTGNTTLKAGTLLIGGDFGTLASSSGIHFAGGTLILESIDSDLQATLDRMGDSAPVTSQGGILTYTTFGPTSSRVFAETLGNTSLLGGQTNFAITLNKTSGSQTLTLNSLNRPGFANSAATFSAFGSAPNAIRNRIKINGAAETPAGGILGPWASTGTSPTAQTDYARIDASGYVVPAAIPGSAENTWTSATGNYTLATTGTTTLTGDRTINTLRYFAGNTPALALGNFNLELNGFLCSSSGGAAAFTLSSTGGVIRQPGTAPAQLYLTASGRQFTITAPIQNHTGALSLVKSGGSLVLLSGTAGTIAYSGDTVVNAGDLQVNSINANNDASSVFIAPGARMILNFTGTDTVQKLHINGNRVPNGIYGRSSANSTALGINSYFGTTGNGTLTVTDTVAPTLAATDIVDDQAGGPVTVNTLVTYTVTFSEEMTAATLSAADFGNAGTAAVSIGTVTQLSPAVFQVPVTPTTVGTLQLRVNAGADIRDFANNPLNTSSAIADDTTLTVNAASASAYHTWAAANGLTGLPGSSTDPAKDADPDNDGRNNLGEFAFNGDPLSGSDNGKVFVMTQDSDFEGDAIKELILTVAVRTGTPVFTGSPLSATHPSDGITYRIEGSLDLAGFPTAVNVVPTPLADDLPAAGEGYEYRSFSLDGSNGLTGKGFLRAKVTSP